MHRRPFLSHARLALVGFLLGARVLEAAVLDPTWSPTAGSGDFNTATNWTNTGGAVPAPGSNLIFGAWSNAPLTPVINLTTTFGANALTFNGAFVPYTFTSTNGSGLIPNNSGISVGGGGTGPITFDASLTLSVQNNQTWNTEGNLSVYGTVTGNSTVTKTGVGTLTLGGANSFAGVTVNQGTLALASSSSTYRDTDGGSYRIGSGPVGESTLVFTGNATLSNPASAGLVLDNAINLGANIVTVDVPVSGNKLTLNSYIYGSGSLVKTGAGTLALGSLSFSYALSDFSGGITVGGGTLLLGASSAFKPNLKSPVGSGTVTLAAGTTLAASPYSFENLDNPVNLTGNAFFGQPGISSTLSLAGGLTASNAGTSATVAGGSLSLESTVGTNVANLSVSAGAVLIFDAPGSLPGSITAAAQSYVGVGSGFLATSTVGALLAKFDPGNFAGTVGLNNGTDTSGLGTIDLSLFTRADFAGLGSTTTGTVDSAAVIRPPANGTHAGELQLSGVNGGTLKNNAPLLAANGVTLVTIGRNDGLGAAGTVALGSSSSNYGGGTNVVSGTLEIDSSSLGGRGALSSGPVGTGTLTLRGGTSLQTPSFDSEFTLGNALALPDASPVNLALNDSLTLSGNISGPGGLYVSSGYLTLSGASTFGGGLTLAGNNAYLRIGSSSTGTAGSVLTGPVGTGPLFLADTTTLTVANDGTQTLHNAITLAGDSSVTIDSGYGSLTLAGTISGDGQIYKTGPGNLVLSGTNTFANGLTVQNGNLILGSSSFVADASIVNSPVGLGMLTFGGYNETLAAAGASTTLANNINLATDNALTIDTGTGALTLSGIIFGSHGITKIGSGSLTFSGANQFYGGVVVSNGTLLLGSSSVVTYYVDPWDISSGPVGIQTLTLSSGTTLAPVLGSSLITLHNPVLVDGSVTIGTAGTGDQLRLDTKPGLDSGLRATTTSGSVTVAGGILTLAASPSYYGTYPVDSFTVAPGAVLVFAFRDSLPTTGITASAGSYVGVSNGVLGGDDKGFAAGNAVAQMFGKLDRPNFAGTFGIDSETPTAPASFVGTFDFSLFNNASFGGLSTLSSGIIAGSSTIFAASSLPTMRFSALNGGYLQIDAPLLAAHNFTNVTVGRSDALADTGTVVLTNPANDYAGGTVLQSGTLSVGTGTALGTGTLSVPSSASANTTFNTVAPGLTIANPVAVALTFGTSGVRFGGDYDFTLAGAITGSGIIDKYSTDQLTLTGDNSAFTGALNILNGTLTLSGAKSGPGPLSTIGVIGSEGPATLKVTASTIIGTLYAYSGTSIVLANSAALTLTQTWGTNIDGVISGSGSLVKAGTESLALNAANTYTGGTTINAGTLLMGSASAVGATGTVLINNGATLDSSTYGFDLTRLNGTGTGTLIGKATSAYFSGNGTFFYTSANAATISTILAGSASLTKDGTGNLTLLGANTYNGGTWIYAGTLTLGNGMALSTGGVFVDAGATLSMTGYPLDIRTVSGSGSVNASNYDYSRDFDFSVATKLIGSGYLTKEGSGTLTLSGANTYTGGTTVSSGYIAFSADNNLGATGSNVTLNGGYLRTLASVTNFTHAITLGGFGGNIDTNGFNSTFAGIISGAGTLGVQSLSGNGILTLTGANTYTGSTSVYGGTLRVGATNTLPAATTMSVVSGSTLDLGFNQTIATLADSGIITGTGTLTLTGAGSSISGAVAPGASLAVGAGASLTINRTSANLLADQPGAIANSGLLAYQLNTNGYSLSIPTLISGPGDVKFSLPRDYTLTNANTYTGATIIDGGANLNVGATSLGSGTVVTFTGTGSQFHVFGNATIRGLSSGFGVLGSVQIQGGNTLTLAAPTVGDSFSFASTVNSSGTIIKNGEGTQTFTGTLGSALTINDGTVSIGDGGTSGLLTGYVTDNAILRFNRTDATSYAGIISGTGTLIKQGAGNLTLTGANTYGGTTSIIGGMLTVGTVNALPATTTVGLNSGTVLDIAFDQTLAGVSGQGGVTLESGKTLTISTASNLSSNNGFSGAGGLAKSGSGNLLLSGINTFTGPVAVNAGTLTVGTSALPAVDVNVAGGATLSVQDTATINQLSGSGSAIIAANKTLTLANTATLATVISGGGSIAKSNSPSALTITANQTYGGATSVFGGSLILGVANALPTTTQLSLAGGALLNVAYSQTIAGFLTPGDATSSLQLAAGATFTVAMPVANTATTFAGAVNGNGTFAVSGAGNDVVNLTGTVANTVTTQIGTGATLVIGSGGSVTGPINTTGTLSFSGNETLNNVISGSGGLLVSSGTTVLSGNNTYTGPTAISGGKLVVTGSNTGGGTVTVGSGGVFAGTGSITGPLILSSGGAVSPGASPGTLSVGATTFAGGASFTFEINNTVGTAGTQWDLLSISGALTITATPVNPFVINLTSLNLSNTADLVANFNSANTYSWQFVSTTGGVTGLAANVFQVNTAAFQNSVGTGSFFVSQTGNNLYLNFTPVPEPSTYALLALGLGVIAFAARRSRV